MFNSPILVFDIETVPDVASGRTTLGLEYIDDVGYDAAFKSINKYLDEYLNMVLEQSR